MVSSGKSVPKRMPRGAWAARAGRLRARGAFTVVEIVVVVAVIALILAIGVPAFNTMTIQQHQSKTRQLLNGTLTRTHIVSVSDRTLAAVRLFPADWHLDTQAAGATSAGRQIMTTYSYRHTFAANPGALAQVKFAERFERIADGPTLLLPPDTWVAPSEALLDTARGDWFNGDSVLNGTIGQFELNADPNAPGNSGEQLLDADDFLIVFDPETGVQSSLRRTPWPLLAYDPEQEIEWDGQRSPGGELHRQYRFQRFNFTGVVIYRREPFVALEPEADEDDRREVLERFGQTYYVSRTGGSLVAGAGE